MKIFLSHSFSKKDESIVKWFKSLITSSIKGCEVISAKKPELKVPWNKIAEKIEKCIAIVGIATRDEKLQSKNEWKTKEWVLTELAYGYGKGMPCFAFVENKVKDLGVISVKEYVPFKRDKLDARCQEKAVDYLKSVLIPFEDQTYSFDSYDKRTCIFNNGHAVCQSIITLYVSSNKFKKIRHSFRLGDHAKKDTKLPSFKKMQHFGFKKRFCSPTFFIKILDDFGKRRKISIEEDKQGFSNEGKTFYVKFTPNLKPGEKVKYGWGWSSPCLFTSSKSSLPNGRKRRNLKHLESGLTVRHAIKELRFEICFENEYPLSSDPWLDIVDHNKCLLEKNVNFKKYNRMYYTVFEKEISPVRQNSSYRVKWKLR